MRTLRNLFPLFISLLVAACGNPDAGGSGSEAGNALWVRALSSSGGFVAEAQVEIRRSDSPTRSASYRGTTGPDGTARLSVPDGTWSVVVRKDGLAFQSTTTGGGIVSDTLRPVSRLAGIVDACDGHILSIPGIGSSSRCDLDGFFQFDALPSGDLPLVVEGPGILARSLVKIRPGTNALVLASITTIPAVWTSLPSDSLIPWPSSRLPASIPRQALGDSGSFSIAVRLRRQDTSSAMWAISWTDGLAKGIRIGWRGSDTMLLDLDGKPYSVAGIPLTTGVEQIGLSWDGHRIAILLGDDSVATLTSSTFDQRSTWSDPEFASAGVSKLDWIAFKRGTLVDDWLRRLSRM